MITVSLSLSRRLQRRSLFHSSGFRLKMRYVKPLNLFEEVKQAGLRLLSADTGGKYSGLSIIGKGLSTAVAFKTCNMMWNQKPGQLGNYMNKLIDRRNVGGLLVGYSTMVDHSEETEHRERVFTFLNSLHAFPALKFFPFTLVDERRSTKNVKGNVDDMFIIDPVDYERTLNKFAAVNFSQKWLDHVNNNDLYTAGDMWVQLHMEDLGEQWNYLHGGWK